jgi:Fe-S-cluster containining protein
VRGAVSFRVNHAEIQQVDRDIFRLTFAPDCMEHRCRCVSEDGRQRDDACCQHGADVSIPEKEAILRRAPQIASVLRSEHRDLRRWFDEREPETDPERTGGVVIRTATADPDDDSSGCVFLQHTGDRGCGLHRAALLHGVDPAEIKPMVCRLYPLSWSRGRLSLSPDFARYSCANDEGPTVYRVVRGPIGELFGADLVAQLDALEASLARRNLRVLSAAGSALRAASRR